MLRRKPEEVLGMWSDALRILDENSMKYYVESWKKSSSKSQKKKTKSFDRLRKKKTQKLQP